MKNISSSFLQYLLTDNKFITADLYDIIIKSGKVLRYADFDADIVYKNNVYIHDSVLITSKSIKTSIGLGVDNLAITAYYDNNDKIVNDLTFAQALRVGYFDGASISVNTVFLNNDGSVIEAINIFQGSLEAKQFSKYQADMTGTSDIVKLNTKLPKNVYTTSCINSLYDSVCKVPRGNFTFNGIILEGSTNTKLIVQINSMPTSGYFNRGALEFTSGMNTSVRTTVKDHTGDTITLSRPLPYPFNVGDSFFVYAGCDKTATTCQNKFNNFINNRAYKYIPPPETCSP